MAKEAILETSTDFYAVPAETESAISSLLRANHINKYDHCDMYTQSKSQFTWDFNSTKALLHVTDLTFQNSLDYEIVKEGFSYRHGEFYLYKFNVNRTTYHFLLVVDTTLYLLLEKDYFEQQIAIYALLTLPESYLSLDFLLVIYDLLTNNHKNFAYYLYLQYCSRAPKIVAAAHHLYPSLFHRTNNNNNDGLLKYTWWHKNYELQSAYISYN